MTHKQEHTLRSKIHVSTPSTNKLQRFIVPSECRGDEGEIPEMEYFKNERNFLKKEVKKYFDSFFLLFFFWGVYFLFKK